MSDNSVDIRDIMDVEANETDSYTKNVVKSNTRSATCKVDQKINGVEDPTSEFLNLSEIVSLDDFPTVDTVPNAYMPTKKTPSATRTYKPHKRKKWTQRKAYELFMGCLTWLKADEDHLFMSKYWSENGIVEHQLYSIAKRYPICQYVLEQCRTVQESRLLEGAAREKLHPGFIKFFLNCRYQDKYIPHTEMHQDIDQKTQNISLNITVADKKTADNLSALEKINFNGTLVSK